MHNSPTAETRAKISAALMGRPGHIPNAKTKAKMSAAQMGHPVSDATRAKWAVQRIGNTNSLGCKRSDLTKEKCRNAKLGKPLKAETVALFRDGRRKGANNGRWKGGTSPLPHLLRTNFQYRQWRSDVFTRDGFTCVLCGDSRGGNLHAHHCQKTLLEIITEYRIETTEHAASCEALWNINNGMTLCDKCHRQVHSKKRTI